MLQKGFEARCYADFSVITHSPFYRCCRIPTPVYLRVNIWPKTRPVTYRHHAVIVGKCAKRLVIRGKVVKFVFGVT